MKEALHEVLSSSSRPGLARTIQKQKNGRGDEGSDLALTQIMKNPSIAPPAEYAHNRKSQNRVNHEFTDSCTYLKDREYKDSDRQFTFDSRAMFSSFSKTMCFDPATPLPASWESTSFGQTHHLFDSMQQLHPEKAPLTYAPKQM